MRKLKILFVAFLSVVLAIFPISLSVASTAPLSVPVATLPHIDIKDISRYIARVGGVPAVLLVVEKLFEGIDWVMDPENNRVIFTPEKPTSLCRVQHLDWTWLGNPNYVANQYCLAIRNPSNRHIFGEWEQYEHHKIARASCNEGYGGSAFVDCGNPTDTIFISYDQIAQEILNNALQGHEDSISFIQEAAKAAAAAEKQTPPASSPASPSTNPESPTTTPPQPVNPPSVDSSTAAPPQTDNGEDSSDPLLSKGGRQNIDNEYVRMIQYKENGDKDPCQFLKELKSQTRDAKEIGKINIALKRFNCDGKDRFDRGK